MSQQSLQYMPGNGRFEKLAKDFEDSKSGTGLRRACALRALHPRVR